MAATTLDRMTLRRGPIRQDVYPIKANTPVIPVGTIVMLDPATGALAAADAATAGLQVVGIAAQRGDYSLGDRKIVVEKGIFCLDNDGTIASPANLMAVATVLDNHTVSLAATTTNDIGAGIIVEVTGDGVWVDMTGSRVAAT